MEIRNTALEYLISMLIVTLPFIIYGFSRKKYRKPLAIVGLLMIPIGFIWDYTAVNILALWSFNQNKIIGIWILGLPLEEWIFFDLTSMMIAIVTLLVADRVQTFKSSTCHI